MEYLAIAGDRGEHGGGIRGPRYVTDGVAQVKGQDRLRDVVIPVEAFLLMITSSESE